MRRDFIPKEVIDQVRSVRWFAPTNQRSLIVGQLFMYYQDVHLWAAPIGGRAYHRPGFRVRLDPPSEDAVKVVLRAIHACTETPSESLQSDVCDFVAREASYLFLFGRSVHEVVHDDRGRPYFFPLPPGHLLQLGSKVGQVVPPDPMQRSRRRIVWLPRRDLWWLRLPRGLGGIGLRRLRSTLRQINFVPPDWSLPRPGGARSDFDLNTWTYETNVLVGKATRSWGHPPRTVMPEQMSSYHLIAERLRFAITMTRIRDHVVEELNGQLARAGQPVRVSIEELPSVESLEVTLGRLRRGEVKFVDALDETRW